MKKKILFSVNFSCSECDESKTFVGENSDGNMKQAKINARVIAHENGWYIGYMPDSDLCPECKKNNSEETT